jgi:hypothetical protein
MQMQNARHDRYWDMQGNAMRCNGDKIKQNHPYRLSGLRQSSGLSRESQS